MTSHRFVHIFFTRPGYDYIMAIEEKLNASYTQPKIFHLLLQSNEIHSDLRLPIAGLPYSFFHRIPRYGGFCI